MGDTFPNDDSAPTIEALRSTIWYLGPVEGALNPKPLKEPLKGT